MKQFAFITTPHVDAYERFEAITKAEFVKQMRRQGLTWGDEPGVRRKTRPKIDGKRVVAIGSWGGRKYVLLHFASSWSNMKLVPYDYPDEWNVT